MSCNIPAGTCSSGRGAGVTAPACQLVVRPEEVRSDTHSDPTRGGGGATICVTVEGLTGSAMSPYAWSATNTLPAQTRSSSRVGPGLWLGYAFVATVFGAAPDPRKPPADDEGQPSGRPDA